MMENECVGGDWDGCTCSDKTNFGISNKAENNKIKNNTIRQDIKI
jgi:hypothetical protein